MTLSKNNSQNQKKTAQSLLITIGFLSLCGLALFTTATLTSCGGSSGASLVTVGNAKITEGDLDLLVRVNPRLKSRLSSPAGRQKILENYVEQELLYQESERRGLSRTQQVKDKIELYKKILIAQAILDDELDRKVKDYYDNHRDEFERVKVSHIFIKTGSGTEKPAQKPEPTKDKKEDPKKGGKNSAKVEPAPVKAESTGGRSEADALKLAKEIKERITKGEDFGKIAKEVSEDEKTKNLQGDLGSVTIHDKKLEVSGWLPLAEKAFAMKVGEVSEPIATKDGVHIIKVMEEKKLQPMDEADASIRFRLQADIRTGLLEELKKKYKVEYAKSEQAKPAATPSAPSTPEMPQQPAGTPPAVPGTPEEAPKAPGSNP